MIALGLGVVEGGVAGVVVKSAFVDEVSGFVLNLTVAMVTGATAFANVCSFLWASLSTGRSKVKTVMALQFASATSLLLAGLAPISAVGLVVFVCGVVLARLFWSGVVTVRSSIWRANYARGWRALIAARMAIIVSLATAVAGVATGIVLQLDPTKYSLAFPVAALLIIVGALFYSRVRMRGEKRLIEAEQHMVGRHSAISPRQLFRILSEDSLYRRYLLCMFVFGSGNLMVAATLVVIMAEQLGLGVFQQILITASIPIVTIPLSVSFWGRRLDRMHIVRFRAYHAWVYVLAIAILASGAISGLTPLLWLGAAVLGTGLAGGRLGWNLGHNDFAPAYLATHYMGLHVTLTGIRGLFAPFIGVLFYHWLELIQPGYGRHALLLPLALAMLGA
ncbi:MAG: MFS transporter, partial [Gammaproteobacteria bacterium]